MSLSRGNLPGIKTLVALAVSAGLSAGAIAQELAADTEKQDMEVVVVTATKSEVSLLEAPASVSVVTDEDIELTATVDVLDVVRQTPGITFQGKGVGGRQVLSIRGMSSDQTLFLLDGRRTLGSDNVIGHSNFQYNWLPTAAIDSIEVVRGPLSSLYGSEALGGVVNVRTKPIPDQWSGSASVRAGFANDAGDERSGGVHVAGPLSENVGALLSYTYNQQDEVPLEADPTLSELEEKESHNVFGRLNFTPSDKHRIMVDFAMTDEERWRDTNSRGGTNYRSTYELDKTMFSTGYAGQFDNFDLNLGAYYAELESVNSATNGQTAYSPQTLSHTVLDSSIGFDAGENHRLLVGAEYRQEELENVLLTGSGGKKDIRYISAFAQDEWQLSDNLTATLGARWDDHENFGAEVSPRAYLVYTLGNNWVVKGGYSHGFRAPTIKQSSEEYRFVGPHTFQGNPDVGPETSDNYELNVTYAGDTATVGVTAFRNDVDDLIASDCVENCDMRFGKVNLYKNIGEAMTQGLETQVDLDLTERVGLQLSHVYLDTEDKETGEELENRSDHTLRAALSWTDADLGLSLRLRAEYLGEQMEDGDTLPSYTLVHAHGVYDVNDTVSVNFGVKNLGDVDLAEKSDEFGYAERNRTVYVGIDTRF